MKTRSILLSLPYLQAEQLRHDEIAHQDILQLSVSRRLTHFALHFTKYQVALLKNSKSSSSDPLCRPLTDSLIIVLAAANALDVNLEERVLEYGINQREDLRESLLYEYVDILGNMAKACEAIDHAESYPSLAVFEQSIVNLVMLLERLAQLEDIDLIAMTKRRWREVEEKFLSAQKVAAQSNRLSIVVNR